MRWSAVSWTALVSFWSWCRFATKYFYLVTLPVSSNFLTILCTVETSTFRCHAIRSKVSPWTSRCQTILHLISLLYVVVRIGSHEERVAILDNTTYTVNHRLVRNLHWILDTIWISLAHARSRTMCSKFNFARFYKTTVPQTATCCPCSCSLHQKFLIELSDTKGGHSASVMELQSLRPARLETCGYKFKAYNQRREDVTTWCTNNWKSTYPHADIFCSST